MNPSIEYENEGALEGLPAIRHFKFRTTAAARKAKKGGMALLLVSGFVAAVNGETDGRWPSFLPPAEAFSANIVTAVERVWLGPTLTRTVRGRPARAPFDLYVALVDSPEVTAAAARLLGLARYEVEAGEDGWYRASDNAGATGVWRILAREPTRRVVLSLGEHTGGILGRIQGSALTVLDVQADTEGVETTLTVRVHIDNPVAAALARFLIGVFGRLADRKLAEGISVTGRVAEWAVEQPEEFCTWLIRESLPPPARQRLLAVLADCL
jgi:hypothetical protein